MKTTRMLLISALALGTASCDGILGGDDDNFTFAAQRIEFTEGMVNEAEVNALIRTIQVDGVFLLPHPCHNMRGSLRRTQGGTVEVSIIASPTSTCEPEVQAMQYRLQTLGFSRGFYRIRVFHEISGQPRQQITEADILIE
jgi:hypothetical protein